MILCACIALLLLQQFKEIICLLLPIKPNLDITIW